LYILVRIPVVHSDVDKIKWMVSIRQSE
jgi:hypothetical protein